MRMKRLLAATSLIRLRMDSPLIRLCDDSDAEFIWKLLQSDGCVTTRSLDSSSWDASKVRGWIPSPSSFATPSHPPSQIEDDIFGGKHVWYCLELASDDMIAVARIAFLTLQDLRTATVDSLFFAGNLFEDSTASAVLKSFLTQIETTAFHMEAKQVSVEVDADKSPLQELLEGAGYADSSGYMPEGSQTMVLRFVKPLHEQEEEAFSVVEEDGGIDISALADLMPSLFQALHSEYNPEEDHLSH